MHGMKGVEGTYFCICNSVLHFRSYVCIHPWIYYALFYEFLTFMVCNVLTSHDFRIISSQSSEISVLILISHCMRT